MYYFRYRAKNIHGWSPGYSPIRAILLATVPGTTNAGRAVNTAATVVIDWDAPSFNGNSAIDGYKI